MSRLKFRRSTEIVTFFIFLRLGFRGEKGGEEGSFDVKAVSNSVNVVSDFG